MINSYRLPVKYEQLWGMLEILSSSSLRLSLNSCITHPSLTVVSMSCTFRTEGHPLFALEHYETSNKERRPLSATANSTIMNFCWDMVSQWRTIHRVSLCCHFHFSLWLLHSLATLTGNIRLSLDEDLNYVVMSDCFLLVNLHLKICWCFVSWSTTVAVPAKKNKNQTQWTDRSTNL